MGLWCAGFHGTWATVMRINTHNSLIIAIFFHQKYNANTEMKEKIYPMNEAVWNHMRQDWQDDNLWEERENMIQYFWCVKHEHPNISINISTSYLEHLQILSQEFLSPLSSDPVWPLPCAHTQVGQLAPWPPLAGVRQVDGVVRDGWGAWGCWEAVASRAGLGRMAGAHGDGQWGLFYGVWLKVCGYEEHKVSWVVLEL